MRTVVRVWAAAGVFAAAALAMAGAEVGGKTRRPGRASETVVFDHKEALAATEDVLSDNGIRQRASDDLAAVWDARNADAKKSPADGAPKAGNGH